MYYVMYLRKSRTDMDAEARGEGETLARHRHALHELAARNGHGIAREYAEVVSGETIASRPQMQRLLMDIADPECAGVYVMEVERLARGDTMDQGRVAQAFLYSNTRIITPTKVYDPQNEFDQEYFEFGLFMSRREYKTINRRIQAGRVQSVREGKYICSRPAYGYRKVKIKGDKGYTLEINPEEAAVVRQIFHWYADDRIGVTRIANRLKDMGVPVGEQGGGWAPCRIYRQPVEKAILDTLRDWLQQYTVHMDPFEELRNSAKEDDALLQTTLERHLSDRDALLKQKSRLHDLLERDVYDLDTFQERLESIQYRLHSLDGSIDAVRSRMKQAGPAYRSIEELAPVIEHVLDVYNVASPAERGQLLRQVISVVDYEKTVRGKPGTNPNLFHLDVFPKIK